ncbi:alanine racemase [Motilimonas pumila]|uniref:Alanine racemase n=1 Tax=Motilimonas pumila TaxID=2303987 RepID=A0A418YFE7_9GAMM|nr:alanine racemase [Motilimonas pumila]RJG47926.1 alanine racemase [Motilimonas pumila]
MKAATAVIDLTALRNNLKQLKLMANQSKVLAVVKANAYGHGLVQIAHALDAADAFGVARIEEALALRSGGIVKPIILLEGFFNASDIPVLEANNIQTAVHNLEQLQALEQSNIEGQIKTWLKLDTGMHRLGVHQDEFASFLCRLQQCSRVFQPVNVMTHFSRADELDQDYTKLQIARFLASTKDVTGKCSLANSAGVIAWPDAHGDLIRPGIALYGVSPFADQQGKDHQLTPVMRLTSCLIAVRKHLQGEPVGYGGSWVAQRDTRLGVVAIGYGDGYPRNAPAGTPVFVNGRIVPIVGRVSMDMLTVDLGPDSQEVMGDEVVLWGPELPVEDVANAIGTIAYELVTKLTQRVDLSYQG